MTLKFRQDDVGNLQALLDDFALMMFHHREASDPFFQQLHQAGLLVKVDTIGDANAWGLTPEGKAIIRRVLG